LKTQRKNSIRAIITLNIDYLIGYLIIVIICNIYVL